MESGEGKPKRGRPRAFDREAALERALALFWEWGYESTSLAMLTEAMSITPPSFYAAFGSKESLFFEAVDRYGANFGVDPGPIFEAAATSRIAFERFLEEVVIAFTGDATPHGCFVISAATNCAPGSAVVQADLRRRRVANEAAMRTRLDTAVAAGELPEETDTRALAKHFAVAVQGMSVQARDGATRAELMDVVKLAMRAWPAREKARAAR